jgi:hypothetical protein
MDPQPWLRVSESGSLCLQINIFLYRTAASGREDGPWCSHAERESPGPRVCQFGQERLLRPNGAHSAHEVLNERGNSSGS